MTPFEMKNCHPVIFDLFEMYVKCVPSFICDQNVVRSLFVDVSASFGSLTL